MIEYKTKKEIGSGYTSTAHVLDGEYILLVGKNETSYETYKDMKANADLLNNVITCVNYPHNMQLIDENNEYPFGALVYPMVKGKPLNVEELNDEQLEQIAQCLVRFNTQLHNGNIHWDRDKSIKHEVDKVNRNIKELSEVLGISVSMLRKHISTLKKMNVEQFLLEEYNGKLVYRLNYADSEGKNFVTVPMDKIPLLLNGLSNNCIKLYTVLLWACRTGEKALTQDWLAEQIGLSKKTKRAIKDNIDVLEKCGLIKVRREYNVKHKLNDGELTGYREPKYYYSIK